MPNSLDNIFGTPTEEIKKKASTNTTVAPVSNTKSSSLSNIFANENKVAVTPVETAPVVAPKKQGLISKISNSVGNFFDRPDPAPDLSLTPDPNWTPEQKKQAIAENTAKIDAYAKANTGFGNTTKNFFKALPSSFVEGLPLGVGEIFKQVHDMEVQQPDALQYVTGKEVVKSIPKGVANFAIGTVKGLASVPLTVGGAVAGLAGKDQEIKFNVPVLGEVSNLQARIVDRVLSGENPAQIGLTEGVGELMNGLWLYSMLKAPFVSRPTTVAEMTPEQTANLNTSKGTTIGETPKNATMKSFREYQKPTIQTPVYTEVNPALMEKIKAQGVDLGKYDPKNPTFFRFKMETNGQITGEIVQVKPSYFNTLKGKFTEKTASSAPDSAFEPPIYTKSISDADLVKGAKSAKVTPIEPNDLAVGSEPVNTVQTPQAQAYSTSLGALATAKPSQVRDTLTTLENQLSTQRETGSTKVDDSAVIANINAHRDVFNAYNEANKQTVIEIAGKNQPLATLEVVPYEDGKYSVAIDANIASSGFSSGFSSDTTYPSYEEAVTAGKEQIQKWVDQQKTNATPTELKQIATIEKELGTATSKVVESPTNTKVETKTEPLVKPNIQVEKPYERTITGDTVDVKKLTDPTYFREAYRSVFARGHNTDEKLYKILTKTLVPTGKEPSGYLAELYGKTKEPRFAKTKTLEKSTQKEAVKETVKAEPKSIKQIAKETGIKEPNVRRILGVGAKEGTFERVDNGVYVLNNGKEDIAYIHTGDAVETLPKLAKDGLKVDMVFLDIPYNTPAVKGGSRGVKYDLISQEQFRTVMQAVSKIVKSDDTPVYYMFSQAESGLKAMLEYNDVITEEGFKVIAKGNWQKLFNNGAKVTNVRGEISRPEGILLFNKSGTFTEKDQARNLDFETIRPKGYSTEKPAELLKSLILQGTKEGDTVIDPFAGSGVTGAEAIKAGRKAILIEKNPQVVEKIIHPRVKQAIIETDALTTEMKPLQAEVGLGEDDSGMLTNKELEASGEAIKILKEDVSRESKAFVEAQNGLYLEPVKVEGKTVEVAGEKIKVADLPKPVLTRTSMVTLLSNSKEFKANPQLVVVEKNGNNVLAFVGKNQQFSFKPSAFGLIEKNLTVGTVIKVDPKTFKTAGTDSFRVNEYKGGTKQSGSFASMDKFRETMEPTERAIDAVNPIEFPELVKLARELTGEFPKVKLPRFRPTMGGRPNGLFTPTGDGKITLNPDLFIEGNEQQAAKTLAHEIGHLIDYLPEHTMSRGNILGRLAVLRNFRKDFFAPAGVTRTNTEMTRELWALSKYWRPVDEATAPSSFLAYRKEPAEMYADFISALFNDPALVQNMAPESYNTFFKMLDGKPEVKTAYFELQDLLAGTSEDLMKARQEDIRKGFERGEDLQAGFQAKKEAKVTKFWERLRQQLDDVNYPILKKQAEAEAAGHVFTENESPRFILQEQSLADNENFLLVEKIDREIVKPLEKAGMIVEDVGEYLLLDRIINERVNIANPFGFNTKNAPKQMDFLKKTVGEKNFELLQQKITDFHDLVYQSVEEAVRVGSYNKEVFETKIKPNKDHYASFQVVDYMQDYIPATVKGQVGTLKEVANPFISTILKTIALNRLNAYQRAKNSTISMLKENFKGEIAESKRITTDGKLTIFKVARDRGALEVLEDGKMNSYDVDPYIAESFKRDKIGDLNMLVSLVDKFNNKLFKPLVTTYNLGFALAFNPIRDLKRNYKLISNANIIPISIGKGGVKINTAGNLLSAYVKSLPEAIKYAKGELDDFTRSLVESKAINAPVNDYNYDARDDELGNILKKYGLVKEYEPLTNKALEVVRKKILKPVSQVLEGVRFIANTLEVVSKIAGAKVRMAGGESGKQLAYNVRNFTGTPNYKTRGKQTTTTNAIFVFSNIMKEGLKGDFKVATDPTTRSGYWWKTVKIDLLPKFLMFLAGAGALGAGIKAWFDKVSEYDKSNYIIIPLGTQDDGQAIYMRIPHDETGRLISSVFWKMANTVKDGNGSELQDVFAIGAGQLPSVSPIISIGGNWLQYLSGRNPYDAFHGRTLIDDTTWQAGGGAALKKMVQWTTNNLGFTKFATYDTSKNTGVETFMQVAPFFSSVVKISNYGEQEKLKAVSADVVQAKAKQTLKEREVVQKYVKQGSKDGQLSLFSVTKYGNQAVKEILGHMPQSKDEQDHADRIIQQFKVATKKELVDDPRYTSLIYATSNDEKKALLKSIKDDSTTEQYNKIKNDLLQLKIVTPAVLYSVK